MLAVLLAEKLLLERELRVSLAHVCLEYLGSPTPAIG
jgi:hypothetical protein